MLSRTPPPLPSPSLSLPSRSTHAHSPRGPGLEPKRSAFLQARTGSFSLPTPSASPLEAAAKEAKAAEEAAEAERALRLEAAIKAASENKKIETIDDPDDPPGE